jgi:UDP-N-acetylglucosamine 1-carboxyvinyltransferase
VNSLVQDAQKAARRVGLPSDTIIINGGRPLRGTIDVRGAKNLVTKAMVASLLGDTKSILRDVPDISDVSVVASLLEAHGVTISGSAETGILIFDPTNVASANSAEIDALSGSSRIPILFCGPLLHRLGHAFIP